METAQGSFAVFSRLFTVGRLQRPERADIVQVGIPVGQVGHPLLLAGHAAPGRQIHQASDDPVQQRLKRFIGGRGCCDKGRKPGTGGPNGRDTHRHVENKPD